MALLAGVCLVAPGFDGCKRGGTPAPAAPASASTVYDIPAVVEPIWSGGLQGGWRDEGWSERELKSASPARVRMTNLGGWMLGKDGVQGDFGGLALRYRAPTSYGDFLEIRLDSEGEALFPRVSVDSTHVARPEDGSVQLFIPYEQLNPKKVPFSRLVLRAVKPVGTGWVEVEELGFTGPGGMTPVETAAPEPAAAQAASPESAPQVRVEPEELAYDNGLGPGWEDRGWAERQLKGDKARLRMANFGGWTLSKKALPGDYGGLTLRYHAPPGFGEFLEVRLDSEVETVFPRVQVTDAYVTAREGEWTQVFVPMEKLNPGKQAFTQLVVRASKKVPNDWVEISQLGLARLVSGDETAPMMAAGPTSRPPSSPGPLPPARTPTAAPASVSPMAAPTRLPRQLPPPGDERVTRVVVDCTAPGRPISPLIYGIAFNSLRELKDSAQWDVGATIRRWGGNPTSRFNWKLGNAWNTANDYFFRNVVLGTSPQLTVDGFLQADVQHGLQSALTVPMLGWVAKDSTSMSFPKSLFGPQQKMDPDVPQAGNGLAPSGEALTPPPPTQTSVEAPPAFINEWVRSLREKDARRGRGVQMYILDNEPMLWSTTHRDVHPEPTSYDELLERTLAYGAAVRQADPKAVIAGPAEWGWTNYFYSAADMAPGGGKKDSKAHGKVPLLAWYLKKLAENERQTGTHILDVVDVHFYPQGEGIGFEERGATDPDTSARRIRSVRALWDPKYKDESWIDEPVELIPRLKRWIAENYPGRGVSIGEYNFGATGHMSGGLAQAEALGRFAEQGLTSAFYFSSPPARSPAFWAFRAFRNFDGKGGRFQDTLVPTVFDKAEDARLLSLFASRSDDGKHVVAIALNLDPKTARTTQVDLQGCGGVRSARVLGYTGEPSGFSEAAAPQTAEASLRAPLPPYSITVWDLTLDKP